MENLYARIFRENERCKELIQTVVLKDFWDNFNKKFNDVLQIMWDEYPEEFWLMPEGQRDDFLGERRSVTITFDLAKLLPQYDKNIVKHVEKIIGKLLFDEGFYISYDITNETAEINIEILDFSIEKLININVEKFASAPDFVQWVNKFEKRVSDDKRKIKETEQDVKNAKIDVLLDIFEEGLKEKVASLFVLGEDSFSNNMGDMKISSDISKLYPEVHNDFNDLLFDTPFYISGLGDVRVIMCDYTDLKSFYDEMLQAGLYEQDVQEQGKARKRNKPNGRKKPEN